MQATVGFQRKTLRCELANHQKANQDLILQNIDLASNTSKLIHDGILLWKTARGKLNGTY